MGIDVTALSPAAQAQISRKLTEQLRQRIQAGQAAPAGHPCPAQRKYHNQPTVVPLQIGTLRAGIRFDSKKEARRFTELQAMETAGVIRSLRLQQDFTLQEAYTTATGERVRAIRYRADFTYERQEDKGNSTITWEPVVEDVKSKATRTPEYIIKRKLMLERFGIEIQEV